MGPINRDDPHGGDAAYVYPEQLQHNLTLH